MESNTEIEVQATTAVAAQQAEPRWRINTQSASLELDPDITVEEWQTLGGMLGDFHKLSGWLIGDWYNQGEILFGEPMAIQLSDVLDMTEQAIQNYAWVARRIPPSRRERFREFRRKDGTVSRVARLEFEYFRAVAKFEPEQQEELLERAVTERLSRWEFRRLVQGKDPEPEDWKAEAERLQRELDELQASARAVEEVAAAALLSKRTVEIIAGGDVNEWLAFLEEAGLEPPLPGERGWKASTYEPTHCCPNCQFGWGNPARDALRAVVLSAAARS